MASQKILAVLVLFATVYCSKDSILLILSKFGKYVPLTSIELDELATAPEEDLPDPVRRLVERTLSGEHICCRNTPMKLVTKARRVRRIRTEKHKIVTGHTGCHIFGTGSCTTYSYAYRNVTYYVTEYYKDIIPGQCPTQHIVCCNMYLSVSGKCIFLDDLHELVSNMFG